MFYNMNAEKSTIDRELIAAYTAGNVKAFEKLYERHASSVLLYLVSLLQDPERAEEILQEIFMGFIRQIPALPQDVNVRSYLVTSGRNRIYNEWRDKGRQDRAFKEYQIFVRIKEMPESLSGHGLEKEDMCMKLNRAIGSLSEEEREVVLLHTHGDFTFDKIARITQSPAGTVATRYRRAIGKLKAELSPL